VRCIGSNLTSHTTAKAKSRLEELCESPPGDDLGKLEAEIIEHQTRVSMTEGAFDGGPFIVLLLVAFYVTMLAQAQMALELAALAGYARDDEMRAADLHASQGVYSSTTEVSAALAKLTRDPDRDKGKRVPRGTRISMVKGTAFMLGLIGSSDEKPSRLRAALQMGVVGAVFLVSRTVTTE
jgi:hypothetical protein